MTKQELRSYQHIKKEISQIEGLIREVSTRMYSPRTPQLTGMPGAASTERGSAQERAATELFAIRDHYEQKIRELLQRQLRIEKAIDAIEDPVMRMLLRYRYIDGRSWKQIAILMNYSVDHIWKKHGQALMILKDNSL